MVKQRINQAPGLPILPCGPRLSQNWKGGYHCVYHMMLHFNFPTVGAQKTQQPGILTARPTCHVRMTWTTISKVKKQNKFPVIPGSKKLGVFGGHWFPLSIHWVDPHLFLEISTSRIRVLVNITCAFFSLKIAMLFFIKTTSYLVNLHCSFRSRKLRCVCGFERHIFNKGSDMLKHLLAYVKHLQVREHSPTSVLCVCFSIYSTPTVYVM